MAVILAFQEIFGKKIYQGEAICFLVQNPGRYENGENIKL